MALAGPGRDLAATLPASTINAGIAVGALVGGWAVAGHGVHAAVLVAIAICALALPATVASGLLRTPSAENGEHLAAPTLGAEPTNAPAETPGAPDGNPTLSRQGNQP